MKREGKREGTSSAGVDLPVGVCRGLGPDISCRELRIPERIAMPMVPNHSLLVDQSYEIEIIGGKQKHTAAKNCQGQFWGAVVIVGEGQHLVDFGFVYVYVYV